jgi:hypothetical protein
MSHEKQAARSYQTSQSVILTNGDICKVGSWVVTACSRMTQRLGRVMEIIQERGSFSAQRSLPDKLLIQQAQVQVILEPYQMPGVRLQDSYTLVDLQVCLTSNSTPIPLCTRHFRTSYVPQVSFTIAKLANVA